MTLPKGTPPRSCSVCGAVFTPKWRKTERFCSKACVWAGTKGPEFNAQISRASTEQRGLVQRGKGSKGYVKVNGRHQHRVVVEAALGRALQPDEIVHHVDGDKHNNDLRNLQVMTQSDHIRLHRPRLGTGRKDLHHDL